jgi:hypothetical protein
LVSYLCAILSPQLIFAALCKATATILTACPNMDLLDDLEAWSVEIVGLESQRAHADLVEHQIIPGIFKLFRQFIARKGQTSGNRDSKMQSFHIESTRKPSIDAKPDIQSADATVTTASGCHTDSSAAILEIVSHKPKSPISATQSPYKTWNSKRSGPEEKLLARDRSAFSDHTASKLKRRRSLNGRGDNDNISSDDGLVVPAAEKAENERSVKRCKSSLPTSIPLSLTDEFSHIHCDHLRLILADWLHALIPRCNWSQTEVPAWWPGNVAFQAPAILLSGGK